MCFWVVFYRKIKVWDLAAALDPRAPAGTLCIKTLVVSHCTQSAIHTTTVTKYNEVSTLRD